MIDSYLSSRVSAPKCSLLSAISTAIYEYETYRLKLTFNNGQSYNYTKVPNHVFEGLRTSESKGKFINK